MALAGCAPASSTAGAPETASGTTSGKSPAASGADCTRATKVTIVAKGSGYAFTPARLTIQRGAFLAVTNKSKAAHPLRSAPDAGIVTSVIGLRERQVIQFPKAGTFQVETGGARLRLTVAGESGCGAPEPALTITSAGTFTPATARVTAAANFAVTNRSAVAQTLTCTPGATKDHTRLEPGETEILALDEPGRYVCAGGRPPTPKVTVTVTAAG